MPNKEMKEKLLTKRFNLKEFASRLEEDLKRISESDNQGKLTSLYQSALKNLEEMEPVVKYMGEMETDVIELKAKEGKMPCQTAVNKFEELFPPLVLSGITSEENSGYMATRDAALKSLKTRFGRPVDVESVIEAVETTYLKYAGLQLTRIDKQIPSKETTIKVLELREKQQELHDCLQSIDEGLPKKAGDHLFEQSALQNIDAKIQEQIEALLSAVEQDAGHATDAVASANQLLAYVERLCSRLDEVKDNFVSDLSELKEGLQWLYNETGENPDPKVNPNKPQPIRITIPVLDDEAEKVEESKKPGRKRTSSVRYSSGLIKKYLDLLLKQFEADDVDVKEMIKKIKSAHKKLTTKKEGASYYLQKSFIRTIKKISARVSKLSAEPSVFESTNNLQGKSIENLKQTIESLLEQETRLKMAKSKLIEQLKTERESISTLSDSDLEKMFKSLAQDDSAEYRGQAFADFKAQFDKFKTDVQSMLEDTSSVDLKKLRAMAAAAEDIKKIKQDYRQSQEQHKKRQERFEKQRKKRLDLNALIKENKDNWRKLLDYDSERYSQISMDDDTFVVENSVVLLQENADVNKIEREGKRQKRLEAKLQEYLHRYKTIEELKADGIFLEAEDKKVWKEYCNGYITKSAKTHYITLQTLCRVKQVLNDLQTFGSRKEYGTVASIALRKAMQKALTEDPGMPTRFRGQLEKLYSEEVMKLLLPEEQGVAVAEKTLNAEKELEKAEIRSIADVFEFGASMNHLDVLKELIKGEVTIQESLEEKIDGIAKTLANHYNEDAAGKKEIETISEQLSEKSKKLSGEIIKKEKGNEGTVSLFQKLSMLRAKNCLTQQTLDSVETVVDKRLGVSALKTVALKFVNFCDYCLAKLMGNTTANSYKDFSRHTLYSAVKGKIAGTSSAKQAVENSFKGQEYPKIVGEKNHEDIVDDTDDKLIQSRVSHGRI